MNSWSDRNSALDRERSGREIAALWDADPGSVRLVNDRINIVYRFEVGGLRSGAGYTLSVCARTKSSNTPVSAVWFAEVWGSSSIRTPDSLAICARVLML